MSNNKYYLPEIDGLRAVAVIAVIINHFFEGVLPSGFLGVDIFFVISGFVISSYLTRTTPENWAGYLGDFYTKRIKRLFPALFFCILFTSILFVLVTTNPPADIFKTATWALFGLSNNYLYALASNYFSLDAKLNPFTHTWSLGVEEQFYLFFPLIFAGLGYVGGLAGKARGNGAVVLAALTALSLAAYIISYQFSENAAFYLIPNRFWELSLGSLAFLAWEKKAIPAANSTIAFAVLVALAALLFMPNQWQWLTTITCVVLTAGLLFLMHKGDLAHRLLTTRVLLFIGQISYSLYLWHWSILVLGKWTIGESLLAKILLLIIAFMFAVFSYYVIERKLRYKAWAKNNTRTVLCALLAALLLVSIHHYLATRFQGNNNTLIARAFDIPQVPDWSEKLDCHGRENLKQYPQPFEHCLGADTTPERPSVIYLLGDSHAAQLVFMLDKVVADMPYVVRFINTEDAADFPTGFMHSENAGSATLDYIASHARAGDYVMMAFHRGHLNESRDKHLSLQQDVTINPLTRHFIHNAGAYIKRLEENGVAVILVKDTPLMQVVATSSSCLLQIRLFGESICRISREQDIHTRYRQDFAFDALRDGFANVAIWDPADALYDGKGWLDVVDGKGSYIMMDWHHITRYQSELLAPAFKAFFLASGRERGK